MDDRQARDLHVVVAHVTTGTPSARAVAAIQESLRGMRRDFEGVVPALMRAMPRINLDDQGDEDS